jgi:hypothetical protein
MKCSKTYLQHSRNYGNINRKHVTMSLLCAQMSNIISYVVIWQCSSYQKRSVFMIGVGVQSVTRSRQPAHIVLLIEHIFYQDGHKSWLSDTVLSSSLWYIPSRCPTALICFHPERCMVSCCQYGQSFLEVLVEVNQKLFRDFLRLGHWEVK